MCLTLLEGQTVNLRIIEKEDLSLIQEWVNNPQFIGKYEPISQETLGETTQQYDNSIKNGGMWFFIEKKDGTKIGYMVYYLARRQHEIGYAIIPSERGKEYATEAGRMLVDYLFLSKDIIRIQADTSEHNIASQRVLEKIGFTREGVLRKVSFEYGAWKNAIQYSILREEWKKPRFINT
jgi:RimJ/RimL family protein N-acetyltransferase